MNDSRTLPVDRLRRRLIVAAAGLAPMARLLAAPTAPEQVSDLTTQELDASLDLGKAASNLRQVTGRWASNSEQARALLGAPRRLSYGATPEEALDLYPTSRPRAPVHVFLHGGGFNLEQAAHFGFIAEAFVRAGAHFVVPDFGRARDHGGDIRVLVAQVRQAVAWVRRNAASFSGDPDRIYLSGHSSGAEMAAMVAITDWEKDFGISADTVKGVLCCSGFYDLASFRLTHAAAGFQLDDATVAELSVQRHLDRLSAPLVIAWGSVETPAFQIGSRAFVATLTAAGKRAEPLLAAGYNHFEVIETLASPYGALGRAMFRLMGLGD